MKSAFIVNAMGDPEMRENSHNSGTHTRMELIRQDQTLSVHSHS